MTSVYSYDTLIQGTLSVLGKATATTPAKTDNTPTIATTAYVKSQGYYVPGSYLNITNFTELGSTSVTPTKKKNETKCSYDLYIL